jgi:hypothetical protein
LSKGLVIDFFVFFSCTAVKLSDCNVWSSFAEVACLDRPIIIAAHATDAVLPSVCGLCLAFYLPHLYWAGVVVVRSLSWFELVAILELFYGGLSNWTWE